MDFTRYVLFLSEHMILKGTSKNTFFKQYQTMPDESKQQMANMM